MDVGWHCIQGTLFVLFRHLLLKNKKKKSQTGSQYFPATFAKARGPHRPRMRK